MSPIIGIPSRERTVEDLRTIGVGASYIEAITAAGGIPFLIPLLDNERSIKALYDLTDGLLFAGGEDVDPSLYNEEPHEKLGDVSPARDFLEKTLIHLAKADKKPILAICRGIQIVNASLGGTLYQDLPSQRGIKGHRSEGADRWIHCSDKIDVASESRLAGLLGCGQLEVNSLHHQAVKDVAPGMQIAAQSADGVIEAIESTDKSWFALGLQCHPETLWQERDTCWRTVFKEFIDQAAQFASSS